MKPCSNPIRRQVVFGGHAQNLAIALASLLLSPRLSAQVNVNVTLAGQLGTPNPTTSDVSAVLITHAGIALLGWTQWLDLSGVRNLEVEVRIEPYPTGTGGGSSVTSSFVENTGGLDVFRQGVAAELATGIDPNGANLDARITIDPAYLQNQLWFDPNPSARTTPVGANRIDAMSFFLHEFGHILAFTGWKNRTTGATAPGYQSTFDQRRRFDGVNWWWTGFRANQLFGGEIPLSRVANTFDHYGNPPGSGIPGGNSLLVNGLMNGVAFNPGQRYRIGLLDLAVLADTGIALVPVIDFSAPRLTLNFGPGSARHLQWAGIPLANYSIRSRVSLNDPWTLVGTAAVSGVVAETIPFNDLFPVPATGEQFYQVLLQP